MLKFLLPLFLIAASSSFAEPAKITEVKGQKNHDVYKISVTFLHDDKGWHDYVDALRLTTDDGQEIAIRSLHHPHLEIPGLSYLTRSFSGIRIPDGTKFIDVSAHDTQDGWNKTPYRLDLKKLTK